MTSQQAASIETRITSSEATIEELSDRLVAIDEQLETIRPDSALGDFETFAANGTITATTSHADLSADRQRTARALEAGKAQLDRLREEKRESEQRARQAQIDAMTMDDAIDFAKDALAELDVGAVEQELDGIVKSFADLDRRRDRARDRYQEALLERAKSDHVHTGQVSERLRLARQAVLDDEIAARDRVHNLKDEARDRRDAYSRVQRDLLHQVASAFQHIRRIMAAQAKDAAEHAKRVELTAKTLDFRSAVSPLPAVSQPDMVTPDELKALLDLAAPALTIARRPAPEGRPESDFAARSPSSMGTAGARRVTRL